MSLYSRGAAVAAIALGGSPTLSKGDHVCHSKALEIKSLHFLLFCFNSTCIMLYFEGVNFLSHSAKPTCTVRYLLTDFMCFCTLAQTCLATNCILLYYYDKKLATRIQPNNCTNNNSPAVFIYFKHYSPGEQCEISIHCQGSKLDCVIPVLLLPLKIVLGLGSAFYDIGSKPGMKP